MAIKLARRHGTAQTRAGFHGTTKQPIAAAIRRTAAASRVPFERLTRWASFWFHSAAKRASARSWSPGSICLLPRFLRFQPTTLGLTGATPREPVSHLKKLLYSGRFEAGFPEQYRCKRFPFFVGEFLVVNVPVSPLADECFEGVPASPIPGVLDTIQDQRNDAQGGGNSRDRVCPCYEVTGVQIASPSMIVAGGRGSFGLTADVATPSSPATSPG